MPRWVSEGYREYAQRLPKAYSLGLREIASGHRGKGSNPRTAMEREGRLLIEAVSPSDHVVALDLRGKSWSTSEFASQLGRWSENSKPVVFWVGGPEGLSDACRERADQQWSLGPLTLPHPLVRVIVAEQIYRAWSIINRHPYHRG